MQNFHIKNVCSTLLSGKFLSRGSLGGFAMKNWAKYLQRATEKGKLIITRYRMFATEHKPLLVPETQIIDAENVCRYGGKSK